MRFLAPENFDTPKHNKQGHGKLGIKENQEWKREARRRKTRKNALNHLGAVLHLFLLHISTLFPQADPRESFLVVVGIVHKSLKIGEILFEAHSQYWMTTKDDWVHTTLRNTATIMLIGLQNKQETHLLHQSQKCIRASSKYRDCDANRRTSDNHYVAPSCIHVWAQLCDQIWVMTNVLRFLLSQSSIVVYCQKFVILVKFERAIFTRR